MGEPQSFSAVLSKGDNFRDSLIVYLEDEVFPKMEALLKQRICYDGSKFFPVEDKFASMWANYFLYEMLQIYMTMKMTEFLPLKVYPFTSIQLFKWKIV